MRRRNVNAAAVAAAERMRNKRAAEAAAAAGTGESLAAGMAYDKQQSLNVKDSWHSGDIPVSNLLYRAVNDVFPELKASSTADGKTTRTATDPPTGASSSPSQQSPTHHHHHHKQQKHRGGGSGSGSGRNNDRKNPNEHSSSYPSSGAGHGDPSSTDATTTTTTPSKYNGGGSEFGSFVRSKLLHDGQIRRQMRRLDDHDDDRRKDGRGRRNAQGTGGGGDNNNNNNNNNDDEDDDDDEEEEMEEGFDGTTAAAAAVSSNKKRRKKKKKKNRNQPSTVANEGGQEGVATSAGEDGHAETTEISAQQQNKTGDRVDDRIDVVQQRNKQPDKQYEQKKTQSLKGCNNGEGVGKVGDGNLTTANGIGGDGGVSSDNDNSEIGIDKLDELLDDHSHSMLLLPTTEDDRSVDCSLEALDRSVKKNEQLQKMAAARQMQKSQEELLNMIPNEDSHASYNIQEGQYGVSAHNCDDEPSNSNYDISNSAADSMYDDRAFDDMPDDDDIEPDESENEEGDYERLISYFTNPLDVTILIAPDKKLVESQAKQRRRNSVGTTAGPSDTHKVGWLDIPVMGTSSMATGDAGGGEDKIEIARALLDAWIEDHLLTRDGGGGQKDQLISTGSFSSEDYTSFVDFCNQRSVQQREQAVGIPFQEVIDAINNIFCPSCMSAAMTEINQLKQNIEESLESADSNSQPSILDTLVLDPSHLNHIASDGAPIEDAFAYHKLEEGHHLPKHHRASLGGNKRDSTLFDENLSFVVSSSSVIEAKPKRASASPSSLLGGGESSSNQSHTLFFQKITTTQVDNFLKDWLPCGVNQSALVADGLSSVHDPSGSSQLGFFPQREFEHYQKKSTEMYNTFTTYIEEMEVGRRAILDHWEESIMSKSVILRSAMNGHDTRIGQHAAEIEAVVWTFAELSHEFAALQFDVWTSYLGALQKISTTSNAFYSRMEELVDQNTGSIVSGHFNEPQIQANKEYMSAIIRSLTDFSLTLNRTLTRQLMKEWATRLTWFNTHAEIDLLDPTDLDQHFHGLVLSLSHWVKPIRRGMIEEAKNDRSRAVTRTVDNADELLPDLRAAFESIEVYFSKETSDYFADFLDNATTICRRWTILGLPVHSDIVFNMAAGLILIWRHVRITQSRRILSVPIPPMPLRLTKWMMEGDDLGTFGGSLHRCGLGSRRLACTLAGLSYSWLSKRFEEWKAEKAEKELLTNFDTSAPLVSSKSATNASAGKMTKKTKKKKNKNASTSKNGTNVTEKAEKLSSENMPTTKEHSDSDSESTTDEKTDTRRHEEGSSKALNGMDDRRGLSSTEVVSFAKSTGKSMMPVDENSIETHSGDIAARLSELEILAKYKSKVCIFDDAGQLSVEDFLVQRYREVLESDDKLIIID